MGYGINVRGESPSMDMQDEQVEEETDNIPSEPSPEKDKKRSINIEF